MIFYSLFLILGSFLFFKESLVLAPGPNKPSTSLSAPSSTIAPLPPSKDLENKVMKALSSLKILMASFVQKSKDKEGRLLIHQGYLYVDGHQKALRLMYNGPKAMDILITKGRMLIYYPHKNESYEYSSSRCPFYFLLEGEALSQRLQVIKAEFQKNKGVVFVVATLVQKKDPLGPKVVFTFSWPQLCILQWYYEDPSGQGSLVGLQHHQQKTFPPFVFSREKIEKKLQKKKS